MEKIDYDKNKLYILKTKQKIYEAYYYVLIDNWEKSTECLKSANEQLQKVENIEEKVKIVFKNLLGGIEMRDKRIFFIKCSDSINELEYINF